MRTWRGKTYTAESVVFVVVFGFLNHVATDDGFVAVVIVGFVGDEVGFAEELLLVILELADHCGASFVSFCSRSRCSNFSGKFFQSKCRGKNLRSGDERWCELSLGGWSCSVQVLRENQNIKWGILSTQPTTTQHSPPSNSKALL